MSNNNNIEIENAILSIGSEFLPLVARKVRDGAELTETEATEYAEWLAGQIEQMTAELEAS